MIEDILRVGLVCLYKPETLGIIIAFALSSLFGRFALSFIKHDDVSKFPLVNGKKWWQLTAGKQKQNYCDHAKDIVDETFKNVGYSFLNPKELGSADMLLPASRLALLFSFKPITASNFFYQPILQMVSETTRRWTLVARCRK